MGSTAATRGIARARSGRMGAGRVRVEPSFHEQAADRGRLPSEESSRLESRKRGTYVLMLLLVFAVSSAGMVIGALIGPPSEATTLVFFTSASFCALSIWAIVAKATSLRLVEEAIWVVAGLLSVGVFVYGLYLAETSVQARLAVAVSFLWLPLAYAAIFVAHDTRGASWRSMVLFSATLAVYLPWATGFWEVDPASSLLDAAVMMLMHLSGAVMIVALLFFGTLKSHALESAVAVERMRVLAGTDALTGLPNRRRLEGFLEGELGRTQRYGAPLSLVVFDLDDFKKINDLYGHDVGDSVLVGISRTVERHLRRNDILGRWGGEEFVIVAPHTTLPGALRLATRIRDSLKDQRFGSVGREVTASFGVASARPQDGSTALVKRADDALLRAKRAGKDTVESSTDR